MAAMCGSASVQQGGLLGGLFLAGAVGSVMHCAPMCGPLVLGQVSDRLARVPAAGMCQWQRVRAGLLVPYHLGRLTTYAALGGAVGWSAGLLGNPGWFAWGSAGLLVAAALLLLGAAAGRLGVGVGVRAPWRVARWIGRVARVLPRGSAVGEYLLGVALGFLPCGLLYGALTVAAASGGAVWGAGAMVAFGVGTVPALLVVAIGGSAVARRWQGAMARVAPVVLVGNAVGLLVLAWGRVG